MTCPMGDACEGGFRPGILHKTHCGNIHYHTDFASHFDAVVRHKAGMIEGTLRHKDHLWQVMSSTIVIIQRTRYLA